MCCNVWGFIVLLHPTFSNARRVICSETTLKCLTVGGGGCWKNQRKLISRGSEYARGVEKMV